ncbi:MAG: hypothetical protein AABX86_01615 [Nanoarchaeota archaeon]
MDHISDIPAAVQKVWKKAKYRYITIIAALVFLFLYVLLPLITVPGNDLAFFFETTTVGQWIILMVLSIVTGMLISMQFYLFEAKRKVAEGTPTIIAGVVSFSSGLFSSAACASCVATVFAFLSTSGVLFLLTYRWYLVAASFLLLGTALVFVSRRIMQHCTSCEVQENVVKKGKRRKQ